MNVSIRPLTPDLWPAVRDLFESSRPGSRCWCMYWRIGRSYRKRPPPENRAALREIVEQGPPPGLVATDGETAVGWCQVTPRAALPWLDRSWERKSRDDESVWSISCLFVRPGRRRRGVTSLLIQAAVDAARSAGVSILEAYPVDAKRTGSASSTGYVSTFRRAGFRTVGYRAKSRPIMWYDLTRTGTRASKSVSGER